MPEFKRKPSLASRLGRPLLAGLAASAAVAAPNPAVADIFLELDGIKGESSDSKFKDQIDVLSYTQSFRNTGTATGGAGTGKVSCGAVTVLKNIDQSSPQLIGKVATGQTIKDGTLTFRAAGGKQDFIYYQITMTDLLVSAIDQTDNADAGKIVEKISLNAATFKFKYTPQKPDGSAGGSVEFGFDCRTNQKF